MKLFNNHFENYISKDKESLHPKLQDLYKKFPDNINNLCNLIFYGPPGVGKYTQALSAIKKYSPSNLKYEKKLSISYNKNNYFYKISDIHYEIDMALLGCNSKILWNEIFNQIVDIISTKPNNNGIIMCKNFHEIHSELLDIFYSYIQARNDLHYNIIFVIITEHISFIPDNIINCSKIINVSRPSTSMYNKCLKIRLKNNKNITNINNLLNNIEFDITKNMLNNLYEEMTIKCSFSTLRELLYDILVYNINIYEFIWELLLLISKKHEFTATQTNTIINKTYDFLKYYNNNYRPIYHLEKYIYCLITIINE